MADSVVHMTGVEVLDGTDSEGQRVLLMTLVNSRGDQSMVLLDRGKAQLLRDRLDQYLDSGQGRDGDA